MIPLKHDYCYAILDDRGMAAAAASGPSGFYRHDTRHLSAYAWRFDDLELIHSRAEARKLTQFFSRMRDHAQEALVARVLELTPTGLTDRIRIENSSRAPIGLVVDLDWDADFADIFVARGHKRRAPSEPVVRAGNAATYRAQDGVQSATVIDFGGLVPGAAVPIAAGASVEFVVTVRFETDLPASKVAPEGIAWRPDVDRAGLDWPERRVLDQALADVESLLLETEQGRIPAAGIPNFVCPFGRDSLITAWMLLDVDAGVARSVLRFLAARQAKGDDGFRDAEPGKIMHEHRESELNRIGELPFRTYYGSADSTPLFVQLLGDYVARTGDAALAKELEPNWRAAMGWIEGYADGRGLINFRQREDGAGLTVQSWKDSQDSMSYADGRLGQGALAVAEVQGYVFAALRAAADLSGLCGGPEGEQAAWRERAEVLAGTVDRLFWMEDEGTYALALDAEGRQLDVVASDAGHLLWSGIVPEDKAGRVIARLFARDMWSGYGLRTLSSGAARYNPLAYHNGSVWPHDTALFAAGLRRCGDEAGFVRVREALVALANASGDLRLPELVGGYPREGDVPPLPYVESCRPQAWSAAAMVFVLG